MTVAELTAELQIMPKDAQVVVPNKYGDFEADIAVEFDTRKGRVIIH